LPAFVGYRAQPYYAAAPLAILLRYSLNQLRYDLRNESPQPDRS